MGAAETFIASGPLLQSSPGSRPQVIAFALIVLILIVAALGMATMSPSRVARDRVEFARLFGLVAGRRVVQWGAVERVRHVTVRDGVLLEVTQRGRGEKQLVSFPSNGGRTLEVLADLARQWGFEWTEVRSSGSSSEPGTQ